MKQTLSVTCLLLCFVNALNAQVLTGDASGESSVLYHGIGLGFKIDSETPAITFSINNYGNEKAKNETRNTIWGINASSKSENGIANIFTAGDIASSFNGSFIIGNTWTTKYTRNFKKYIEEFTNLNGKKFDAEKLNAKNKFEDLTSEQQKIAGEIRGYWLQRHVLFADGGYSTSGFKRFIGADPVNYSNSFINELFSGYHLYGGYNIHIQKNDNKNEPESKKSWLFGIKTGLKYTNNISALTARDYTIRSTETNGGQQLITEKKVTAYPGSYNEVMTYPIMLDAVFFTNVNDSNQLAINTYVHHQFSADKTILPRTTDIGVSVSFFREKRSKFLGGLYVELPDLENNIAKSDPAASLRPALKRLTFGIVAKYTFSSIFAY